MDGQAFDDFTRRLGSKASRRSVLRGVVAGTLAVAGFRKSTTAAPMGRVDICHYDKDYGTFHLITVNGNAIPAHERHGDGYLGTTEHCSACGDACQPVDACTPAACTDGACNQETSCQPVDACTPAACVDGACNTASSCGDLTCNPDGTCGCPTGTIDVGGVCRKANGETCTPSPLTTECASGRCNMSGTCIGCVNSQQCVNALGAGYTCTGNNITPGICQAPA